MISIWITTDFGRNPINDGSPPRDRSVGNIIQLIATLLLAVIAWLTNEMLNYLAMNVIAALYLGLLWLIQKLDLIIQCLSRYIFLSKFTNPIRCLRIPKVEDHRFTRMFSRFR
jgi:hypothetical protein